MSYILDALKRSEQERHQGELNHATIDTIMMPKRQASHHWWPYVLIAVLCLNIFIFLYFQIFSSNDVQEVQNGAALTSNLEIIKEKTELANQEPQPSYSTPAQKPSEKALPSHLAQMPKLQKRYDVNTLAKESEPSTLNGSDNMTYSDENYDIIRPKNYAELSHPVDMPEAVYESQTQANKSLAQAVIESDVNTVQQEETRAETSTHRQIESINFDAIAHINDMNIGFQKQIPNIRFNSHIYSPDPADRRVMINDLYLREGQDFSGVIIEVIGEFYIVLSKKSQRFKIPVLRDWYAPS